MADEEIPSAKPVGGRPLPKNFTKHGYIEKKILSAHRRDIDGKKKPESIHPALAAEHDPFGFDCGDHTTSYSLNKKGRWKLVEEMRTDMSSFQDDVVGLQVSAIEKVDRPGRGDGAATAYHAIDTDGTELHKMAAKTTAQEQTLIEKPKPKQKRERKQKRSNKDLLAGAKKRGGKQPPLLVINPDAPASEDEEEEPYERSDDVKIRYDITTKMSTTEVYKKEIKHERVGKKSGSKWGNDRSNDPYDAIKQYEREMIDDIEGVGLSDDEQNPTYDDEEPTATNQYSLADFLQVPQAPKFRVQPKSDEEKGQESLEPPSLRQLSYQQQQPSSSDRQPTELNDALMEVQWTVEPITLSIAAWCLEPDLLTSIYGKDYYECACLPRRFCINLEQSAVCVFELESTALADTVLEALVSDEEFTTDAKVWINANSSQKIAWEIAARETYEIGDIFDAALEHVQKISLENPEKEISPRSSNQRSSFLSAFPSGARPKTECLDNEQMTETALNESKMTRKLQRQLTAAARYQWYLETGDNFCGICFDWPINERGLCLAECQHWFCIPCWQQHCAVQIQAALVPITCPDVSCEAVVDYDILTTLLPLQMCKTYASLLSERHLLQQANNWLWCPNERCGKVIRITGTNELGILVCNCGQMWCQQCSLAPHWPAACEHAINYANHLEELAKEADKANAAKNQRLRRPPVVPRHEDTDLMVTVKRCPRCKAIMERHYGCNHMVCRCGLAFCWSCLKPWEKGGGEVHYSCTYTSTDGAHAIQFVRRPGEIKREAKAEEPPRDRFAKAKMHSAALGVSRREHLRKNLREHPELEGVLDFFVQTHSLLESVSVWLCSYHTHDRTALAAIRWSYERLSFVLDQIEVAAGRGLNDKVDELRAQAKSIVRSLTAQIVTVRGPVQSNGLL